MPELINPMWKCEGADLYEYFVVRDGRRVVLGRVFKEAMGGKWHCSLTRSGTSKSHHAIKDTEAEAKSYIEETIKGIE